MSTGSFPFMDLAKRNELSYAWVVRFAELVRRPMMPMPTDAVELVLSFNQKCYIRDAVKAENVRRRQVEAMRW